MGAALGAARAAPLPAAVAAAGAVTTVPLDWVPATVGVDADRRLLLWVRYHEDGSEDWLEGWRDDDGWRCAESGALITRAEVLAYAEPAGPTC
jgi:hypothetical protein